MRSEGFDVIILDAGNLLFKKENLGPGTPKEIAKATAKIIISGFNEIGCAAFSPGSKDFAAGLSFVQEMQSISKFPFISANIHDVNGNRIFDPYVIVDSDSVSVGIIGLASSFNHSEIFVQDPIEAISEFINEVNAQVDIIVLLFDSEETDLTRLHASNLPIDLIVRSKAKTQSSDGGNKNIPAYSCGDRGKYVYQFDLHYTQPNVKFTDLSFHEKQISRSQQKLNKMKQGNLMTDLRTIYKEDPITLKKIDTYESQIKKSKNAIANSINTISLKKHALDKNVLDRPDVLNLVDSEKSKRDELYGPLPPSKGHRHLHDHDGDGVPDH
tara:strand:+ start:359 stop:1339 length:981 start_codon:yes stop_codon:yes gene_type:complete